MYRRHTVVVLHLRSGSAHIVGGRHSAVSPSRQVVAVDEQAFHIVHHHIIDFRHSDCWIIRLGVEDAVSPIVFRLDVEQLSQRSFRSLMVYRNILCLFRNGFTENILDVVHPACHGTIQHHTNDMVSCISSAWLVGKVMVSVPYTL